ncbi:MAG: phosphate ABC transporter substrate-binding protein PstS family protein [Thermomicrobiales bacterium]
MTTGTVASAGSAVAGAQPKGPAACVDGSIVALGSTALQPLVEAAAKAYTTKCPNGKINVQGGGSGTGLTQVFGGGATIGDSDIFAEEAQGIDPKVVVDHQVVVQGFAMAANPGVQVSSLTGDQVVSIWTGKVTNWKDVGGNDLKITIINRPTSSGTRATFKKYALKGASEAQGLALTEDSTGAVAKAINDTPGAVGYLGLAYFQTNKDLKQLKFNGKDAVAANFSDDSYPIWSYGHMYTKGDATGLAKAFIDYILSDDIQTTLVPQLGYIPASQVKAKHTPT